MYRVNVVMLATGGKTIGYGKIGQFLDRVVARRVLDVRRNKPCLVEFPLHLVH
jgi:hypothetical protein